MNRKDFLKIIGVGIATIAVPLASIDTFGNPTDPILMQRIRVDKRITIGDILKIGEAIVIVVDIDKNQMALVQSINIPNENFRIHLNDKVVRIGSTYAG